MCSGDNMVKNTISDSELCLTVRYGNGDRDFGIATIDVDGGISFEDCLPISVEQLEYVIETAKRFIAWRKRMTAKGL